MAFRRGCLFNHGPHLFAKPRRFYKEVRVSPGNDGCNGILRAGLLMAARAFGMATVSNSTGARLTPGRVLYLAWYRPFGFAKKVTENGLVNSFRAYAGEQRMKLAASSLTPVTCGNTTAGEVAFLTGRNHWHQTSFCAWSLLAKSRSPVAVTIYDDGSLDDRSIANLTRTLVGVRIVRASESEDRLDRYLPRHTFPTLRHRRQLYPHLRKLMDVHVGRVGPIVVLDSDMLFVRRPDRLLDWLQQPAGGCCMEDYTTSYGYPIDDLEALLGEPMLLQVNVGVTGLISEEIDWNVVEFWCAELMRRHGASYFLEQALCALLFSQRSTLVLPSSDYIVRPNSEEIASGKGILQHYVAESKYAYLGGAWKQVLSA